MVNSEDNFVNTFWLTRIVVLRYIGFIYTVAFLVSLLQNPYLIGHSGLSPADLYLEQFRIQYGSNSSFQNFLKNPTLLWFLMKNGNDMNWLLNVLSWVGLIASGFVMFFGKANKLIMLLLWMVYMSIVNVGQEWFSFGWESQLLESGFLAIFMCHTYSLRMFALHNRAPFIPLLLYRWLLFRIMIGAGMIKIRGDICWKRLTCMNYHYQTQPVPNPLSFYLHKAPDFVHTFETLGNHIIELMLPWMLLLVQPIVKYGGYFQILFQAVLIASGNLSFLNWLTILPALACFNDKFYERFFDSQKLAHLRKKLSDASLDLNADWWGKFRLIFNSRMFLLFLVVFKSIPVLMNIVSANQIMNTSFDPFRLVNTYGAFGSITKTRMEVIMEGTYATRPLSENAEWYEYEFKCKPGNIYRRPCLISPYHYRLDWLMWFAAFQDPQNNPWFYHLVYKFLINDGSIDDLISHNPFKGKKPPIWIRALHYRYTYADASLGHNSSQWWSRKLIRNYLSPVNLETLQDIAKDFQWDRNNIV